MKHRIDNLDSVREYDRRRGKLSERIALNIQTTKAMRQKPGYGHAHSAVSYAIRTGRIVKQPCQMCGTEIGIHAHHDDYTKPLDVMWLCVVHHKARHAFLDYMTQKPIKLNVTVHLKDYPDNIRKAVFVQVSPKPYNDDIWEQMDRLRTNISFRQ